MSVLSRLASTLAIRPGEGRTVLVLLVLSLLVGIIQVFSARAAEPLFLVTFGAHTLPYLYIGAAVATTAAGMVYARLATRLSFAALLVATLVALLFGTCVLRLLLWLPAARWPVMLLAIWVSVQFVLVNVAFWSLAGRLFTVRQSKRLFGLIGSAEVVATIGCGVLTPALVSLLGTPNLLWIAAGGIAGALLCVLDQARHADAVAAPAEADDTAARPEGDRGLLTNRYVLLIVAFTSLSWLGWYVVDNLFYEQAAARYPGADPLAGFLGVFGAVAGCLTLLSRTAVTGPVISRFGLTAGLLACPVVVGVGAGLVALSGVVPGAGRLVFWCALLAKLASDVLEASIYQSAFLVLYQPFAPRQRLHVQATVETFVEPVAVACAGVLLLLLINGLGVGAAGLASIAAAILLVMCVVGVLLARAYPVALLRALAKRRLRGNTLSLLDRSTAGVLQQGLRSRQAGTVVYCLDLLESIGHESLEASLRSLLDHPAVDVRHNVLLRIERLQLISTLPAVRQRVDVEPSAHVRGSAVRVLAALGDSAVVERAGVFLNDPDPAVKQSALIGLLGAAGSPAVLLAEAKLLELARSPQADERVLAAHALGAAGNASLDRLLLPLLQDRESRVRVAAVDAAGQLNSPQLWPLLIEMLAERGIGAAAAAALVAAGEDVVPQLRATLAQPVRSTQVLTRIARLCGRIRGSAATALLEEHIAFADPDVRKHILAALLRCGYHAAGDGVRRSTTQIRAEVAEAAWIIATLVDIGAGPATALLQAGLSYRLEQCRERVLLLLALLYDAQAIQRAGDNLTHASGAQRAYALEVLELQLAPALRPGVLAVFDDLAPVQRLQGLNVAFPQPRLDYAARLVQLVDASGAGNSWIKACALYSLSRAASPASAQVRAWARSAQDPLVQETAAWIDRCTQAADQPALAGQAGPVNAGAASRIEPAGGRMALSTIEKVLILKGVSIFAATPDEILVDVTALLEEVELAAGQTLFEKGDIGACMYIVVDGRVRVHDGERTLDQLGEGDVFGEMAVLDAAPRVASVTGLEATRLLRLDQDALYDVMADRIEVVRGIIGVLSGRLRARVGDIAELSARVEELTTLRDERPAER